MKRKIVIFLLILGSVMTLSLPSFAIYNTPETVTFTNYTYYAMADLDTVDWNYDGYDDVIFITNSQLYVDLNNQDGTYTRTYLANTGGQFVFTLDYNQDGLLDVMIIHATVPGAKLLYGNDTSGVSAPETILDGNYMSNPKLIDFDQDGDKDLLYASSSELGVFENVNGIFNETKEVLTNTYITVLEYAFIDADGDNDLDLYMSASRAGYVSTQSSPGVFDDKVQVTALSTLSQSSYYMSIVDIDQDGDGDFVGYTTRYNEEIIFSLNDGTGTFGAFEAITQVLNINPNRGEKNNFSYQDYNFDGYLDIAYYIKGSTGSYNIHYGSSSGFINTPDVVYSAANVSQLIHVDVDQNGLKDVLLYLDSTNNGVKVIKQTGNVFEFKFETSGGTPLASIYRFGDEFQGIQKVYDQTVTGATYQETFLDVDNDGDLDLVKLGYYFIDGSYKSILYKQLYNGTTFDDPIEITTESFGGTSNYYVLHAFKNGQFTEIYFSVSNNPTTIKYVLLDETGTPQVLKPLAINNNTRLSDADFLDIDGDEDLDIIHADYTSGNVYASLNNGDDTYTHQTLFTLSNVVDIDIYQDTDLIYIAAVSTIGKSVEVYAYNGTTATLLASETVNAPAFAYFNDYDQDGSMDVITSESATQQVFALDLNDMSTRNDLFSLNGFTYHDLTFYDITGDGLDDIILTTSSANESPRWYVQESDHTFTQSFAFAAFNTYTKQNPQKAYFIDIDDDGDVDMFYQTYSDFNWYLITNVRNLNVPTLPTPERFNYTFEGWYVDEERTIAYDETLHAFKTPTLVLYAKWLIAEKTVKIIDDSGTVYEEAFDPGDDLTGITLPTPTEKVGYTFTGWSDELPTVMPDANVVIEAEYEVNQYTITFDTDGGSTVDAITQDYGTVLTQPTDPTKAGHTFTGWFTDDTYTTPYVFDTVGAENITLYAGFDVDAYTLNLVALYADAPMGQLSIGETITFFGTSHMSTIMYTSTGSFYGLGMSTVLGNPVSAIYGFTNLDAFFSLNEGETIVSMDVGYTNTLMLTSEGRLLAFGSNVGNFISDTEDTNAYLGVTDITPRLSLQAGESITRIQLPFVFTSSNRVFIIGENIIIQNVPSTTPEDITPKLNLNAGEYIVDAFIGYQHSYIFITNTGRLVGINYISEVTVFDLGSLTTGDILDVFSVQYHTYLLTTTYELYYLSESIAGSNTNFNTGLNTTLNLLDGVFAPTDTVVGYSHGATLAFLLEDGSVITNLEAGDIHLSMGTTFIDATDNLVLFEGEKVVQIDVGSTQIVMLTNYGRLFGYGNSNNKSLDESFGFVNPANEIVGVYQTTLSEERDFGTDLNLPTLPNQGSLIFTGWSLDPNSDQVYDGTTMPEGDLTLYPVYSDLSEIDMSQVIWDYEEALTYNGTEWVVTLDESTLPEGVTVLSYSGNTETNAGTYIATVTFDYDETLYLEPTLADLEWTINKATFDLTAVVWTDDSTFVYDGTEKKVELLNLPEGLTATYIDNVKTDAGTYMVDFYFTFDEDNYNEPTFDSVTWSIDKATFDMSEVTWNIPNTVPYRGSVYAIMIENLPEGLVATELSGNEYRDAGTYTATAIFTYDEANYYAPVFDPFVWTIEQIAYDMSNVYWDYEAPFTYDGSSFEVLVYGLPEGISVNSYTNNVQTQAGEYSATVELAYDEVNYIAPSVDALTWVIEKAIYDMSGASWNYEDAFTYNGTAFTVSIIGLPEGVTVDSYVNATFTNAGTYTASVYLNGANPNYEVPMMSDLTWSIEKATYDMSGAAWDYTEPFIENGSVFTVLLTGLPAGVTPIYNDNEASEPGRYTASVSFTFDQDNYEIPYVDSLTWHILGLYTMTFDVMGTITTQTDLADVAVIIPEDPEIDGYIFKGWSIDIPEFIPKQDLYFTATFIELTGNTDAYEGLEEAIDLSEYQDKDVTLRLLIETLEKTVLNSSEQTFASDTLEALYGEDYDYVVVDFSVTISGDEVSEQDVETLERLISIMYALESDVSEYRDYRVYKVTDVGLVLVTSIQEGNQISFDIDSLDQYIIVFDTSSTIPWLLILPIGLALLLGLGYGFVKGMYRKRWFIVGRDDDDEDDDEDKTNLDMNVKVTYK